MSLSARVSTLCALSALALGLALPGGAQAQDEAAIVGAEKARDAALAANIALDYVTQLTTRFGPRPAGSASETAAAEWAAGYMRDHGFRNVRIQEFPLVGWERGQESAAIVGANPQPLVAAALGHSPATPEGGIEAEVVRFATLEAFQAVPDGSLAGKVAYVDAGQLVPMQTGAGYSPLSRIRSVGPGVAGRKGAVAFIMRSAGSDEHRMPHTGTTRYVDGVVPVPAFALSAPDADQLSRLVGYGAPVRVRLSSTARTYQTTSRNVIGDLPGRTRPDEIIVLGSHMDSWDLGTGAIDDGAGGAITLAAARVIADQGRTARTLRVILYGSEEVSQPVETGNGGGAYLRSLSPEDLANHVFTGESDFGADRVHTLQLPVGVQTGAFADAANRVLYPIGVLRSAQPEREGGVDIGPIVQAGVPVFGLKQDGLRYFDLHHTADDTLDKIDPEQLTQNVAAWAGLVSLVANSDVDFRAMAPATPAP
ncbi:peptidase M20 [Brevundimonas sp. LM2]|uniref:M28 family peptidase n=1 Tax=Brevundimonas sp. LM2 TaxID=1938605 RepID=UPI000983F447|nr:M28 family peptidase [Brevundimonas sp. LM2]AQR62570.1 peptidase M20 [Brevundimonas sp. LM2]